MNKMKVEKKSVKQDYYVGIRSANDLRRNLLESSKSVVMSLENFERIKQIETEKTQLKSRLKDDVKELKMLFLKLEKLMPDEAVEGFVKRVETPKQQAKIIPKKNPKNELEDKEIEKLHKHLAMIEERLSKLK